MKTTRLVAGLGLAIGCILHTSTALADGAAAAEHAKKAQAAYDVQSWATAIQEYQAAYQQEPKPEYLWGLAQAQRQSGDCAGAIKSYKAFKRNESVSTKAAEAAELQITKCEAEIEKKEAEAAKKANEQPAGAPPPAAGSAPAPAPAPAPPPPPPPSGPKPFYADVLGDVLLVGGVVAVGVGGYFLLSGNSDMAASSKSPTYKGYDSAVEDAEGKQTTGAIVLGAGGVLVGLAVVRYLTMDHGTPSEPKTGLVVGPGSVGWVGRF